MEEAVSFKFSSLANVTFWATRTVAVGSDDMQSDMQIPVGWIRIHAEDDRTSETVMDGGSTGPETADSRGIGFVSGVRPYFFWEVKFRFDSLPDVTFYASRSTEDVYNETGGLQARGWITVFGRRDADGYIVYQTGTSGPTGPNDHSKPREVREHRFSDTLSLRPLKRLNNERCDWGVLDPVRGNDLVLGLNGGKTICLDLATGTEHPIILDHTTDWAAWQQVAIDPQLAICDRYGGIRLVKDPSDPQTSDIRIHTAERPGWGTWANVDGQWKLALGQTGSYLLLDPAADDAYGQSFPTQDNDLRWACTVHFSSPPDMPTEPQQATVLVAGGRAGVSIFDLATGRRAPLPEACDQHAGPAVWGCATRIGGVDVIAAGGAADEVILWCMGLGGIETVRLPNNGSKFARTTWGAWGSLGSEPVLAVGSESGSVYMWYPRMRKEPHVVPALNLRWGQWGSMNGRPVLIGDDGTGVSAYELTVETSVSERPDYRSDAVGGAVDVLDRQVEAKALAEVVASRTARPPLAIGIFGQWGEGKSHFIGLLHEEISQIADSADSQQDAATVNTAQHRFIRQVRFNAWHYSETDLWASLVSEIFGQLSAANSAAGSDVSDEQRQQSRLLSEIVAERRLPERIAAEKARGDELRRARAAADVSTQSRSHQPELRSALADIDPDLSNQFDDVVKAAVNWRAFRWAQAKRVLGAMPWLKIALVVAAAATVALVVWLCVPTLPARVIGGLCSAYALFHGYLKLVAPHLDALRTQLAKARDAVTSVREASQRLADKLNRDIDTALLVSDSTVTALEVELRDLTAAGQLAGVVAERVADGTYRQSLGLMTEIREDFERMSKLLTRDHAEADLNDVVGDGLPKIDRIVLYIDDLDRCPPTRVVEVLEAVHLMLAVEVFVVVLAVDPRWLHRAVSTHYRDILTEDPQAGERAIATSTPTQYLEKIFQIVLHVPELDSGGYAALLENLVARRVGSGGAAAEIGSAVRATGDDVDRQSSSRVGTFDLAPQIALPVPRALDVVDPLAFDADELTFLRALGPPLIATPRAVKRLVNSYALMTAIRRRRGLASSGEGMRPALLLLALLIGFPDEGPLFLHRMQIEEKSSPDLTWSAFLTGERDKALERVSSNSHVATILIATTDETRSAGVPVPESISEWTKWIPSVGRLTFLGGSTMSGVRA